MPDTGWLFLYTPIPYLAAMYLVAYRHDLGRLARPFRDLSSDSEWYAVCRRLEIFDKNTILLERSRFWDVGNLVPLAVSFALYIGSAIASFFLPWYYLCAIQAAVAAPLFVLVVLNWTGPIPSKPYRDTLPYPRLGTRVRHVKKDEAKATPAVPATGGAP
ncbi:MAG: hypothetical protein KGI38_03205 [Thaumarchaeota archaeon]|nr:hypothetical protein [Nitrososphaerota archaeon]